MMKKIPQRKDFQSIILPSSFCPPDRLLLDGSRVTRLGCIQPIDLDRELLQKVIVHNRGFSKTLAKILYSSGQETHATIIFDPPLVIRPRSWRPWLRSRRRISVIGKICQFDLIRTIGSVDISRERRCLPKRTSGDPIFESGCAFGHGRKQAGLEECCDA